MDKLDEHVIAIIANALELPANDLAPETSMYDVAKWDSLSHTFILLALEKEFNVSFDVDDVLEIEGVQDLIDIVRKSSQALRHT